MSQSFLMLIYLSPFSSKQSNSPITKHKFSLIPITQPLNLPQPGSDQPSLIDLSPQPSFDFIQSSHTTQTDQFNVDLSIPTSNPPQPSTVVPIEQSHHLPNSSKSYTSRPCFRTSKAFVWF